MLTYWGNKASGNQKELQSYLQLHQQAVASCIYMKKNTDLST